MISSKAPLKLSNEYTERCDLHATVNIGQLFSVDTKIITYTIFFKKP